MAAPTFVAYATDGATGSSVNAPAPTGVQAGDYQIAIIGVGTSGETVTTPTGWTLLGSLTNAGGGDSFGTWVYATTTVTGAQAFAKSGTREATAVRLAWRGHGGGGSFAIVGTGPGTSHAINQRTVSTADSLVIAGVHTDGTSLTFTPPSGWQERADLVDATETNQAFGVAEFTATTIGTVGGTFASSASEHGNTFALVLAPSAPTGLEGDVGQVTGPGLAQPIVVRRSRAVGLATEPDSAQAHGPHRKAHAVAQAAEASTAHGAAHGLTVNVGQAAESGEVHAVSFAVSGGYFSIGQATEADEATHAAWGSFDHYAFPITVVKSFTGGQVELVTEPGEALPITAVSGQFRAVGQATEAGQAHPATHAITGRYVELGLAEVFNDVLDVAPTVTQRYVPVEPAAATDTALAVTARIRGLIPAGQASHGGVAQAITARVSRRYLPVGQASHVNEAQQALPPRTPPTFQGTTSTSGVGTDVTLAQPSGLVQGDLQIVVIGLAASGNAEQIVTVVPPGWTLTAYLTNSGGGDWFTTYVYTSTVATGTATFTKNRSGAYHAVRATFRDHSGIGVDWALLGTSGTTHSTGAKAAALPNAMLIGAVVTDGSTPQSFTPPSGWTERYDAKSAQDIAVTLATRVVTAAGSYTGAFTSATPDFANTLSIVLEPAFPRRSTLVGRPVAAESALLARPRKLRAVGQATDAELGRALTSHVVKRVAVRQADEDALALATSRG